MFITKKSMLSTAVKAALIGAITIPMVGCDDAETYNQQQYVEAAESFTQQQRQQLVGNVQGVVLDSNGNPLADANVSIGTQTTTTDTLGYYAFADVAAVNVALNTDSNVLAAVPLVISVSADGHLGGRTQASPTAISDTQQFIYIDGFTAQAANLYLPELDASVKATLRSNLTGEIIANQEITLEFVSVNTDDAVDKGEGEFDVIGSKSFSFTTDASGEFVAQNLPANSTFQVLLEDYRVDEQHVRDEVDSVVVRVPKDDNVATLDFSFTTAKEAIVANWGEIFVTEEIVADRIAPFVRLIENTSNTGRLEKGENGTSATGGLVFEFSENISLAHLDSSTIKILVIQDDKSGVYDTAFSHNITTDNSVTSIRLNLSQAIKPGQQVNVYFERADFLDTSESKNKLGLEREGLDNVNDTYKDGINDDDYVQYTLFGYEHAEQVVGNPSISQITIDSGEFSELNTHNNALTDVANATGVIEQLNSTGAHTQQLLAELTTKLTAKAGILPAPAAFYTDVAKVTVTFPTGTDTGKIYVVDSFGQTTGAIITPDLDSADVNFDAPVEFLIAGAAPGHTVKVRAEDSFGAATSYVDVELLEKVAPTTVIQNSYLVDGDTVTGTAGEATEIDGGHDVTVGENGSLGYPYLTIAPGILDLEALGKMDTDIGSNTYSNNDFTNWDGKSLTTAVAFSESIEWINSTHTPNISNVNSIKAGSFEKINNVQAVGGDVDNSAAKDFITFDIENIFDFADSDGGSISFDSTVKDLNGNTAHAATVVVRDALPPMIIKAELTGEEDELESQNLEITFSENIASEADYTRDTDALTFRLFVNGISYSVADGNLDIDDVDFSTSSLDIDIQKLGGALGFEEGQKITDLKVHIADQHGNEGDTQFGDELATTFNYNHVAEPAKTLTFKIDNKITVAP